MTPVPVPDPVLDLAPPDTVDRPPVAGHGSCADCACPGYSGSAYACGRGGCGHHFDRHW